MSVEGKRPLCQDTGIITCFVKVGMDKKDKTDMTVQQMVDEGTSRILKPRQPVMHQLLQTQLVRVKTPKTILLQLFTST